MSHETHDLHHPDAPHPKGLYVLFATEMWERFSFYSMLAMFTLYMKDAKGGFGWPAADATTLYANYMMFVYLSPLIGGWIADQKLGHRRSVMIGGVFFMAGHGLLSFPTLPAVYAALVCLVIGNGFFKPNVSTMVGALYPDASPLKDRAYNIFYMGINIGAMAAPLTMWLIKDKLGLGYHPAFAAAAFGMVISVAILWKFQDLVQAHPEAGKTGKELGKGATAMDEVPESTRIGALIVVYTVVIVFWMVFHQNGSTLTYWADTNTDWLSWGVEASGVISGAINPFWVLALTPPLVIFWRKLGEKNMEPSTPTKICIGMFLTGLSFFVLYFAALQGEGAPVTATVTPAVADSKTGLSTIAGVELTAEQIAKVEAKVAEATKAGDGKAARDALLSGRAGESDDAVKTAMTNLAYQYKVSPGWLIFAFAVVTLGELMLSPMGLSLVSKVAPPAKRGLMMGGWFVATAIGNKLTQIGVYWEVWSHSYFFMVLGAMAIGMGVVLIFLLKPLKKAMPNV